MMEFTISVSNMRGLNLSGVPMIKKFKCYIDQSVQPNCLREFKKSRKVTVAPGDKIVLLNLRHLMEGATAFNLDSFSPGCKDYIVLSGNVTAKTADEITVANNDQLSFYYAM